MKVDGPKGIATPSGSTRKLGRGDVAHDGEFARALEESAGGPGGSSAAAGINTVNPLFALQEVDDPAGRPAKARRRAETILDKLDQIRDALLSGSLSQAQLTALAAAIKVQRDGIDDPGLTAILDEVDLRAQVELAKFEAAR
ncbi:MAG: flagellar assembly protein FliX [Azospirillaceae bacterium]|nr:flagellar assembly protein FliX [Azospirillaceae bacterium]